MTSTIIYINDLPGINNIAKCIIYADDAYILVSDAKIDAIFIKFDEIYEASYK